MKKNIYRSLLAVLALVACVMAPWTATTASADNYLHIDELVGRVNATANVPVYLTNSDQVVAAQFDITLPFNMPEDGVMTMTTRTLTHQVSSTCIGTNTYRVVLSSMSNQAVKGNSGLLLRVPMAVVDKGAETYPIYINNVVLSDKNGNNIATETSREETFTVSHEKMPNLTVGEVKLSSEQLTPGSMMALSYTILNSGDGPTLAGWTAKFYMESMLTGEKKYVGSQYYSETMAAGGTVSKDFEVMLPTAMRMDGDVRALVEVVPANGCGELIVDQADNTGYSSTVLMNKFITLSPVYGELWEGWRYYGWDNVQSVTLERSGDCSVDEAFNVTSGVSNLFYIGGYNSGNVLPTTVVIPAGYSSTKVSIRAVNDNIVRAKEDDVTFSSDGYSPVSIHLIRHDNDRNPLSLTLSVSELTEGNSFTVTATRGGELLDAMSTTLTCSAPGRFEGMPQLEFKPGESTCKVEVKSIDDDIAQLDKNISFSATASDYARATASLMLLDNDRPTITLKVSPSVVGENAGSEATTAYISRKGLEDQDLSIRLYSLTSEVYTGSTYVQIPAGESSVEVPVGVVDNSSVDGSRVSTLVAALYMRSEGCTAPKGDRAYSLASVEVVDDESPYLTMSSRSSAVGEGSSCTIRVNRVVSSYNGSLTVYLNSADESSVTVPASVTIASGRSYAEFTAKVSKNTVVSDDRLVTITASGTGISNAQYELRITDRTLPDAAVSEVTFPEEEMYSGCPATLTATVQNVGNLVMYKGKTLTFYYSDSYRLNGYAKTTEVYSAKIDQDIAAGESVTLTFPEVILPEVVGSHWLFAKVERDAATQEEFSYSNNNSPLYDVFVKAPFSCTELATDKTDYLPGEFMHVTGKVEGKLNGQYVRIDVQGNSQRSNATVRIDENGSFEANVQVDRSAYGKMVVKAMAVGQTEASISAVANVYNMRLSSKSSTKLDCNVDYPVDGTLVLTNLSNKTVTGLQLAQSALPYGMELDLSKIPSSLDAGKSAEINYTVTPGIAYTENEYKTFYLTATCNEGVKIQLNFSYMCHATTSNIVYSSTLCPRYSSITTLNTTVALESEHVITVDITNWGLKETGSLALSLPEDCTWAKLLSQETLPSLAPNQTVSLRIQLNHQQGMHSGQSFSTRLLASPENGAARLLTINMKVVGTEYSKFTVSAQDVYSLQNSDFSHLQGARVSVVDTRNSSHELSGVLGKGGTWTTDRITEGTYEMTIQAPRHKKVSKVFSIGPGDEQTVDVTVPYYAVVTEFMTSQDLTTNEYKMVSDIDIDYDAPQGIVVPTLPEEGLGGGKDTLSIVLTNVGKRAAYNPEMKFCSYISGYSFKVLNDFPAVLYPGEKYVLSVAYEGPENSRRRYIGIHDVVYGFAAGTGTLYETDDYQQLMGTVTEESENPGGDNPGGNIPPIKPYVPDGGNDATGGIVLPSYDSSAELSFDEVDNVKTDSDFGAVLDVKNGSGEMMGRLRFIPMCYDSETDEDLSELVTCNELTPEGFVVVSDGKYNLADNTEGKLPLSFTFDASLTENGARKVLVGGQMAYYDGAVQSTQMFPMTELVVSASGKIQAIYLVKRNYMADNAETTELVEDARPSEVVMLLTNEGFTSEDGDDVVVGNEDLALVSDATLKSTAYQNVYSSLDGEAGNYDYFNANLGKLTTEGMHTFHWMNVSDEMAHVGNAEEIAEKAHLTSGSIFEYEVKGVYNLERSVSSGKVKDGTALDELNPADRDYTVKALTLTDSYLLDMQEDEWNTPDAVMTADGNVEELENVSDNCTVSYAAGECVLTVEANKDGWIYGEVNDPTNGQMLVTKVVRNSDGAVVSAANFWQTDYAVASDYSLVNANTLHFADFISNVSESYTITYMARPGDNVKVVAMHAYTADGIEVASGATTTEAVTYVRVSFNKEIKNLYGQYVSLRSGDKVVPLTDNRDVITKVNGSRMEYEVSLKYAELVAGQLDFTVNASGVKELGTNLKGEGTMTITWNQNLDLYGDVNVSVASTTPSSAETAPGSVNVKSGTYNFGQITFKATAAPGWKFAYWQVNGEVQDCGETLAYKLEGDAEVVAYFTCEGVQLKLSDPEKGRIIGSGEGLYDFCSPVNLTVECSAGMCPDYWLVNGEKAYAGMWTVNFNIVEDTEVSVVLKEIEADGITDLYGGSANSQVYSISGMKVGSRISKPGIYVVNGKKIVIRK